jgi:hypothetical protein
MAYVPEGCIAMQGHSEPYKGGLKIANPIRKIGGLGLLQRKGEVSKRA